MRLGVNVDHVATLRQARRGRLPDPVEAALVCERSGASSIVCHLREDRRHIQDRDVWELKRRIRTRLNLEMSIAPEVVEIALAVKPHHVTLVPERRQELTTEGGLDVVRLRRRLAGVVEKMERGGIETSLFIDPAPKQVRAAQALGVSMVELHTGAYADAASKRAKQRELALLKRAATLGRSLGLRVAAGHGVDYANVRGVCAIPAVEEMNIGFSIIAQALRVGLSEAVTRMVLLLARSPGRRP